MFYNLRFRSVVYLVHRVERGSSASMYDEVDMSHAFLINKPLAIRIAIIYHMIISYT
jgi:hypothetical protein